MTRSVCTGLRSAGVGRIASVQSTFDLSLGRSEFMFVQKQHNCMYGHILLQKYIECIYNEVISTCTKATCESQSSSYGRVVCAFNRKQRSG